MRKQSETKQNNLAITSYNGKPQEGGCIRISSFPGGSVVKESACQFRRCRSHWFDPWVGKIPLEKEMATHSSILAWRIPWTEEPGGPRSLGS